MLTQMYIAMHPWAPHTVLFHAKKSHCQHIYQTVREILPVLVSVCQVHTLCKHIKCLRICKDIYKSVCTVVQTCILKYSSELSFCWHPRPSGLPCIKPAPYLMNSNRSPLYHTIKQTLFRNRDLHLFPPIFLALQVFFLSFSLEKIMLTHFLVAVLSPVLTTATNTTGMHNVNNLRYLISSTLYSRKCDERTKPYSLSSEDSS